MMLGWIDPNFPRNEYSVTRQCSDAVPSSGGNHTPDRLKAAGCINFGASHIPAKISGLAQAASNLSHAELNEALSTQGTLGSVQFGAGEKSECSACVLEFAAGGQHLTVQKLCCRVTCAGLVHRAGKQP